MTALAFLKFYNREELMVLGGIIVVILGLLGLMANGIMQSRGFGIFGNAILLGVGGAIGVVVQSYLMTRPDVAALGLSTSNMLVGALALFGTFILLIAALLKRHFA